MNENYYGENPLSDSQFWLQNRLIWDNKYWVNRVALFGQIKLFNYILCVSVVFGLYAYSTNQSEPELTITDVISFWLIGWLSYYIFPAVYEIRERIVESRYDSFMENLGDIGFKEIELKFSEWARSISNKCPKKTETGPGSNYTYSERPMVMSRSIEIVVEDLKHQRGRALKDAIPCCFDRPTLTTMLAEINISYVTIRKAYKLPNLSVVTKP